MLQYNRVYTLSSHPTRNFQANYIDARETTDAASPAFLPSRPLDSLLVRLRRFYRPPAHSTLQPMIRSTYHYISPIVSSFPCTQQTLFSIVLRLMHYQRFFFISYCTNLLPLFVMHFGLRAAQFRIQTRKNWKFRVYGFSIFLHEDRATINSDKIM